MFIDDKFIDELFCRGLISGYFLFFVVDFFCDVIEEQIRLHKRKAKITEKAGD